MSELPRFGSEQSAPDEKAESVSDWITTVDYLLRDREGLMQSAIHPLKCRAETDEDYQHLDAALLALRSSLNELFRRTASVSEQDWSQGQSLSLARARSQTVEGGDHR